MRGTAGKLSPGARSPPGHVFGRARTAAGPFTIRALMLPALATYGVLATPQADGGALPCLWRVWLGLRCPGCGLSRANALLVDGSLAEALAMNWLIVPLWLVAIGSFVDVMLTFIQEARHG